MGAARQHRNRSRPRRPMRRLFNIALAELEKAKKDIGDDEVERAKNKIATSLVLSGEVPLGRMRSIGGQWIYNREYRSLEQDMATLMAVTPQSLIDPPTASRSPTVAHATRPIALGDGTGSLRQWQARRQQTVPFGNAGIFAIRGRFRHSRGPETG